MSQIQTDKGAKEGLKLVEVFPYVDVTYFGKPDGIKEMIVLKDKLAQNEFEFEMEIPDGLLIRNDPNGMIVFYKELDNVPKNALIKTKDYFYFDRPFMVDNSGERSEKVEFRIEEREGRKFLKVTADKNWLLESIRNYPVMIDPSITTVGTNYSTLHSFQKHVWHDGTRYWVSYADEDSVEFYYSTNVDAANPTWTHNSSASISFNTVKWDDTSVKDTSQETATARDLLSDTTWTCQQFTVNNTGLLDKAAVYTSNAALYWGKAIVRNLSPTPTVLTEDPRYDRFASNGSSDYQWNDFNFKTEPVLTQGTTYDLCLKDWAEQNAYWSKDASGVYCHKIYLRPLETNWSIWADSSNAFVVYHDNMDVKGSKASSYPGTGFSWETATTVLNGGTCGNKDQVAGGTCTGTDEGDNSFYDFAYFNKDSSNYAWVLARQDLFSGTSALDDWLDAYSTTTQTTLFDTVYSDDGARYTVFKPDKTGRLDKVDVYVRNSCGAAHTLTGKVAVTDCTTSTNVLTEDITSGSLAGNTDHWVTLDFSKEPLLKRGNSYRICLKSDVDYCVRFRKEGTIGSNVYKTYLKANNSQIMAIKESDATNKVPDWSDTLSTPSAITASDVVYPNILPLSSQDMYTVWSKNGALEGSVWDNSDSRWENSSGTVNSAGSNVDSVGTGATALDQNFSLIRDNSSNLHIGYVSGTGTMLYKKGTVNATPGVSWSSAKTLDSGTSTKYVSATQMIANNAAYFFWRPSSGTIRYNKLTLNTNAWDSANTDWLTFLTDYLYRRPLSISSSSSQSNYQVLVTLDTASLISAGKMQSDCDDVRFTDSDKTTLVDFWLESGCNTSSTKFWVEVPSIPNGSKTIYLYYGNDSASSASNGGNTFLAFDDFDDGNLTGWTGTYWSAHAEAAKEGSYGARGIRTNLGEHYLTLDTPTVENVAIEAWVRNPDADTLSNAQAGLVYAFADSSNLYSIRLQDQGDLEVVNLVEKVGGVSTSLIYPDFTISAGNWYKLTAKIRKSGTSLVFLIDVDDVNKIDFTDSTPRTTPNKVGLFCAGVTNARAWIDTFRVRKYTSPEPTLSVGIEEGTLWLGTDLSTAHRILMLRQQGAAPTPYQIYQDSLDTGIDRLMRGGKWFENNAKQRYSF